MAHRCSNAAEGSFEVELAWPGCDAVLADFASQNNLPPTASPASWERLTGAYPGSIRFDSVGNNGRFLYSAEILRDLPLAMSAERFQRYLTETSGNDVEACRLYTWNAAISSAFYGPLQALEVTLRNAAHDKLRHHFGGQWFRNASVLDGDELRMARMRSKSFRNTDKLRRPARSWLSSDLATGPVFSLTGTTKGSGGRTFVEPSCLGLHEGICTTTLTGFGL
jgi:hypothetical protein